METGSETVNRSTRTQKVKSFLKFVLLTKGIFAAVGIVVATIAIIGASLMGGQSANGSISKNSYHEIPITGINYIDGVIRPYIEMKTGKSFHRDFTNDLMRAANRSCTSDDVCGKGTCGCAGPNQDPTTCNKVCTCTKGWTDAPGSSNHCDYEQRNWVVALILSIFLGELGIDRFYLAYGNSTYIFLGVLKLISGGCYGFFWLIDIILIATGSLPDGNGVPLAVPW